MGDEIQAVKSGILEIADVFDVNKADRDGADRAAGELEQRLELGRVVGAPSAASDAWQPPVLQCVALTDRGLPELVQALARHRVWLDAPHGVTRRTARRRAGAERLLLALVCERMTRAIEPDLARVATRLVDGAASPHAGADELLRGFLERAHNFSES
jgi:LAO/AO transport system kinase